MADEDVSPALVFGILLWIIPGGRETQRYYAEYFIFIGDYDFYAGDNAFRIDKKKFNLSHPMDKEQLKQQLKGQIVEFLNLTNVKPEDIKDDEPLFGEGLGLDSIDSIELIVLLSREYGINIQDPKEGRKILVDINTMVAYIEKHRTK